MKDARRYSFQPPESDDRAAHVVHFLSALYRLQLILLGLAGQQLHQIISTPCDLDVALAAGIDDVVVLVHVHEHHHRDHVGASPKVRFEGLANGSAGVPGLRDGILNGNAAVTVHGFPFFALDGTDGLHERHRQSAVILEEHHRVWGWLFGVHHRAP